MRLLSKRAHVRRVQQQLLRVISSVALAVSMLLLVNQGLTVIAAILLAVSKWQVLLGGPRLWLHNLWDNLVDIVFIFTVLALLVLYVESLWLQLAVIGLYLMWQLAIKPMSGVSGHAVQSLLTLTLASIIVFIQQEALFGVIGSMAALWLVAATTADHFLISLTDDVSIRRLLSAIWSLVVVQVVWLFGHWLVFYVFFDGLILIPQAALVLLLLGYMFGAMYYDHFRKQLNRRRLYLYLGLITLVTVILVVGSEWVEQL